MTSAAHERFEQMIKVTALTGSKHDPSSRFRIRQFIKPLQALGVEVNEHWPQISRYKIEPLPWLVTAMRIPGLVASRFSDITWLGRELISGRSSFEHLAGKKRVFDVDDAIWLPYGLDFSAEIAEQCEGVIAGNRFLAQHYESLGARVWLVPTSVDTDLWRPADGVETRLAREGAAHRLGLRYRDMLETPRATTATWNLAGKTPEIVDNLQAARGRARELEVELIGRLPRTPVLAEAIHATSGQSLGSDFEYRRTLLAAGADVGLGRAFAVVPQVEYGFLAGDALPQESFYLGGSHTLRALPGESLGGTRLALFHAALISRVLDICPRRARCCTMASFEGVTSDGNCESNSTIALVSFPVERPMSNPARRTCAKYFLIVLAPRLTVGLKPSPAEVGAQF